MPYFSVQRSESNSPTDIALSRIPSWSNTLIEADRIYNLFCWPSISKKCSHLSEQGFWDEAPFDWDKYTHLFLNHTKNKFGQILLLSEPYLALAHQVLDEKGVSFFVCQMPNTARNTFFFVCHNVSYD